MANKRKKESDLINAFFGLLTDVRERAEELLDELITRGEEKAKELKERALRKEGVEAGEAPTWVEEINKGIRKVLSSVGIITIDELAEINKRIDKLAKKVERGVKK